MKRLAALLLVAPLASAQVLECTVADSDDHFILYPEQQIYQSPAYQIYVLMGGQTVAVVQRETLRFNRFTNLNLLPLADRLQQFSGRCQAAEVEPSLPTPAPPQ